MSDKFKSILQQITEMRGGVIGRGWSTDQLNHVQAGTHHEEEQEQVTKIDRARALFKSLVGQGMTRQEIIDKFMNGLGVTDSTATSYYERIAKEFGLTGPGRGPGMDDEQDMTAFAPQDMGQMPDEELDLDDQVEDPEANENGVIRQVDNAHLVWKRKNEEGTFDELWIYNVDDDMKSELKIRRAILAGTDIPPKKTQSEDGSQKYTLTTMGNGQMLHITGLPQ